MTKKATLAAREFDGSLRIGVNINGVWYEVDGGSSAATTTQQAAKEPTRYVTINWDGPDWMRDGINGLLDEIYTQSKTSTVFGMR